MPLLQVNLTISCSGGKEEGDLDDYLKTHEASSLSLPRVIKDVSKADSKLARMIQHGSLRPRKSLLSSPHPSRSGHLGLNFKASGKL